MVCFSGYASRGMLLGQPRDSGTRDWCAYVSIVASNSSGSRELEQTKPGATSSKVHMLLSVVGAVVIFNVPTPPIEPLLTTWTLTSTHVVPSSVGCAPHLQYIYISIYKLHILWSVWNTRQWELEYWGWWSNGWPYDMTGLVLLNSWRPEQGYGICYGLMMGTGARLRKMLWFDDGHGWG